ncbi:hypothetical protein D3C81_1400120 [compost metagenome]
MNRCLGLALPLAALAGSGLSRGFLLGPDDIDLQSQCTSMIAAQRIAQATLLTGVEQRALPRIQMQMPAVAVHRHQRAVGRDAGGHSGQTELGKQLQPFGGQAGGRHGGRLRLFDRRGCRYCVLVDWLHAFQIGIGIHVDRVVVVAVIGRLLRGLRRSRLRMAHGDIVGDRCGQRSDHLLRSGLGNTGVSHRLAAYRGGGRCRARPRHWRSGIPGHIHRLDRGDRRSLASNRLDKWQTRSGRLGNR